MKILKMVMSIGFLLCSVSFAQAPKGWEKLPTKGEQEAEFLGSWKNEEGTVSVTLSKSASPNMPKLLKLPQLDHSFGIGGKEAAERARDLKEPFLGWKIEFKKDQEGAKQFEKIYLIALEKGFLEMKTQSQSDFQIVLNSWDLGALRKDPDGETRKKFEELTKFMKTATKEGGGIKIDTGIKPPTSHRKNDPKTKPENISVTLKKDGTYLFEGRTRNLEFLEKKFSEFAKSKTHPRLSIRGKKEVVFKHCRKVIKAAASAGINEVIFAAYPEEEKE